MASQTTGEIIHYSYIRFRATGVGNLQIVLRSLDPNNVNYIVPSVPLQVTTNRNPLVWCNFQDQNVQLHGFVQNLGEDFFVTRIILYGKPVAFNYPM